MKATVVVTDGEQRAALASVRSLGRAGCTIHVCSAHRHPLAGSSRHASTSTRVADPLYRQTEFVDDLLRLSSEVGADVLLPVSEASLLAILPNAGRFNAAIPFPPANAFRQVCDKRWVMQAARSHGIDVPAQVVLASEDDASHFLTGAVYPLVLKPHRSIAGAEGQLKRTSISYAFNDDELAAALSAMPAEAYPVLAQQRIEGPGCAISVLLWDGELRAAFAHRRIREKPPSGGVSVLRESIPLDQDLLQRSLALLGDLAWEGVAMVEFKLDRESGTPYIMEINGRLWGSLQLAIDAGVDFPRLLVSSALGYGYAPVTEYRTGVRSRWEWGDVDHLLASVLHPRRALALPRDTPRHSRLGSLINFLRSLASDEIPEVFRLDDPRPFLRESVNWFRRE